MAQKINPLGFRLGTTQRHHSIWFAQPKNYSANLQEDEKIRNYIKNYVKKYMKISLVVEEITCIEIQKGIDVMKIKIYTAFFKLVNKKPTREMKSEIKEFQRNLEKKFYCVTRKLTLTITKIAQPYRNPKILAAFISDQLKKRVSFRKAMKKAIELSEKANTKGIRVQIAGRLDGKEIARVESIQEGRLPLQTIRAKIDYFSYPVQTTYGVLGIKIWIFLDEE
uniref:ribosomal protein S3 n=1 Tax=Cyananthus lobatus TaxID=28490 RepID=UPI0020286EB2|nr:ribosomal protein S3 [Cyananthus lobatus]UPX07701.1 ribosomal protein S3 [Cyananthus lobatus]